MRNPTHSVGSERPASTPAKAAGVCRVPGCDGGPLMTVAGDGASLSVMCLRHALAWTDSTTCRDFAQYDELGYLGHLTGWAAHER